MNSEPDTGSDISLVFGPGALRDTNVSLRREWLVTNGIGGYASATLATANTRRYHGLLVAALNPPVGRAVLLSKLEETLQITGADGSSQDYALSTNVYPGALYPNGYETLQSWSDTPVPAWCWTPAPDVTVEKQIWMAQGRNVTYIAYTLVTLPQGAVARLSLVPLLAWRDYHSEMAACNFQPPADWTTPNAADTPASNAAQSFAQPTLPQTDRTRLADSGTQPGVRPLGVLRLQLPPIERVTNTPTTLELRLLAAGGQSLPSADFTPRPDWYHHFQHPREQERGQDFQEDLYTPGTLFVSLQAGQTLVVIAGAEPLSDKSNNLPVPNWPVQEEAAAGQASGNPQEPQGAQQERQGADVFTRQLTRAATQFIVQVPGVRTSLIAGYPWFSDWGRDTMIALPGLCLTTGRTDIAREILLSFAGCVSQGMLPNRFPDVGETPEYNAVDATLWYFAAIYRYVEATGDIGLLRDGMWSALNEIIRFHQQGTRYNIHVDPADGLLYAGQTGVQLTWMDAKVGDWVVTPRIGKPVEINALWYNALRCMAHFADLLTDSGTPNATSPSTELNGAAGLNDAWGETYIQQADVMQASFARRFAREDGQGLYDVLDTPDSSAPDASVRPNQVFALSLPFPVVAADTPLAASIIQVVREQLLTPGGLRTLSPHDPNYQPRYEGDQRSRDGAYHQGTAWPWLLGPFAEAYAKVTGDTAGAKAMLAALQPQFAAYGVGSLSEIYDGGDPQRPNGCVAQAWSVAETLRVWQWLHR